MAQLPCSNVLFARLSIVNSNDATKSQDIVKKSSSAQQNVVHDSASLCTLQFTCKNITKSFAATADAHTAAHDMSTVELGVDTPEDANNWMVLLAKVSGCSTLTFAHNSVPDVCTKRRRR